MSGRRKKLDKKTKRNNVILLILLSLLIVLLIILSIKQLFFTKNYYRIEPRTNNVEKMKAKETDDFKIYGWIRVQGTDIDYPLVGTKTETSPLPVNIEKYAWLMPGDYKYHNVVNIMGHNIMNLSSKPILHDDSFNRFEELMDFIYYDFVKENKYIQLTMDGNDYLYQIFAVGFMGSYDWDSLPYNEYSKNEKKEYLDIVKNNSIYDFDVKVNDDDKFITLATCTRFEGFSKDDFYVAGRLIKKDDKVLNYSVKKNKKYEKIEKVLKGDDQNDTEDNA